MKNSTSAPDRKHSSFGEFFRGEICGFAALYLLNFIALGAIFFFLDGFSSLDGLLYFFLLSIVFLSAFFFFYRFRKKRQYNLQQEGDAAAAREREKSIALEKRYEEHLLFINRWVHYIKTPLSVIRSITQEPSSDPAAALEQIQGESDRILEGVNSALNFARATDFVTDFKIEEFDLREMFVELINDLKMNFIRSRIYPDLQVPQGICVNSDRKWLKFIFFQLLTNAIKYSDPEKKVSIYIREGSSAAHPAVCVADSGIGIPKEDLPRIFDIFFTGSAGRLRGESTGIGLYLVKTICDRLGYGISVESDLGKGSCFITKL